MCSAVQPAAMRACSVPLGGSSRDSFLLARIAQCPDLGSRNGSTIRSQGDERSLRAGDPLPMAPRTVLALPGGITLERSGRSIPLDGERPGSADDGADELRVTRLLVTRP